MRCTLALAECMWRGLTVCACTVSDPVLAPSFTLSDGSKLVLARTARGPYFAVRSVLVYQSEMKPEDSGLTTLICASTLDPTQPRWLALWRSMHVDALQTAPGLLAPTVANAVHFQAAGYSGKAVCVAERTPKPRHSSSSFAVLLPGAGLVYRKRYAINALRGNPSAAREMILFRGLAVLLSVLSAPAPCTSAVTQEDGMAAGFFGSVRAVSRPTRLALELEL
ncbi:hypothetical protein NDA11_001191 [Ustilago hordei]|uniref:Uncharacterized protein n=1 Tax=Ustilago hordei TaxID=120017 RepID=I2FY72_USTHO|nr:uncharacterized protein UHO2_04113 [Ustilago hordei]KAJ1037175.1 hypothetical protein NDA10_004208 [Ustilago hordei]KAJ1580097.1 hypothetical protein NDA15_006209 [Ustilago hordei]KAJ1581980.1 hypothetical protein NDA12_006763 [Ustilago hordei]KAJ1582351.1 hypothetical protein NDA11_001191 [Ustilago hordei]KAJ1600121.1 hypothetical protein NDA14_001786 [Ustilago hordei]